MGRALLFAACWLLLTNVAIAQQVNHGVNNVNTGDSFFEQTRVGWSVRGNGWAANFGAAAPPPFGFDGTGGLQGGGGFGGNGFNGGFGFGAVQGSSRTSGSTSASVTTLNGYPGYIFDGQLRPFVTEIVPVVATYESPVANKLRIYGRGPLQTKQQPTTTSQTTRTTATSATTGSSATRGDESVASIRRRLAEEEAARTAELTALLAEADRLATAGDPRAAANVLSKAALKLEGAEREKLIVRIRQLRDAK